MASRSRNHVDRQRRPEDPRPGREDQSDEKGLRVKVVGAAAARAVRTDGPDQKRDGDRVFERDGARIIVDRKSGRDGEEGHRAAVRQRRTTAFVAPAATCGNPNVKRSCRQDPGASRVWNSAIRCRRSSSKSEVARRFSRPVLDPSMSHGQVPEPEREEAAAACGESFVDFVAPPSRHARSSDIPILPARFCARCAARERGAIELLSGRPSRRCANRSARAATGFARGDRATVPGRENATIPRRRRPGCGRRREARRAAAPDGIMELRET